MSSVACGVYSVKSEVWSVKCGVVSSVKFKLRGEKCEV